VPAATVAVLFATASPARADTCDIVRGPARKFCEQDDGKGGGGSGGGAPDPTDTLDPLQTLAKGFAEGAAWTVDRASSAVKATGDVDYTNSNFLQTYASVFAAATFLVLLLWLWAVAKRAIRGVPVTQAIGEAIGLLWLAVLASAFTPLILYTVVQATDGITQALVGKGSTGFFDAFAAALRKNGESGGGGPVMRIILSLVSIIAAGVVWLELTIRAALLYVGAVLGTIVYAGLVDKELWNRVRKWVGMMAAIILAKPIIVIVLRLASALENVPGKDTTSALISGLSIIIISIVASAMLFRFIPGMGDEIVAARRDSYDPASKQSLAAITRPAATLRQGINTHASRDAASRPAQTTTQQSASGGISAHATRPTGGGGQAPPRPSRAPDMPRQDDRGQNGAQR